MDVELHFGQKLGSQPPVCSVPATIHLCAKESWDIHTVVLVPSKHSGHVYFTNSSHFSTMPKNFTFPWPHRPRPTKSRERKQSAGQKSTCAITSLLMGLLFLLMALTCAFFRAPIHDFVDLLIRQEFALTNDSMLTPLWMNPPLVPKLQVYLFNVTNAEAFLAGEQKLKVQEIGPYTYSAPQVKKVQEWSQDQTAVTYQSKTTYTYLDDLQSDLHEDRDEIVIPNLIIMTGQ